METGNKNNCHVILANDPDADRMQLAERRSECVCVNNRRIYA